jgi:hypothetical protein
MSKSFLTCYYKVGEDEVFKSITTIDEMVYRLQGVDYRLLTPEYVALIEFIMMKGCRRKALSQYQDGPKHEMDCVVWRRNRVTTVFTND